LYKSILYLTKCKFFAKIIAFFILIFANLLTQKCKNSARPQNGGLLGLGTWGVYIISGAIENSFENIRKI
jgi:hypothetical protein